MIRVKNDTLRFGLQIVAITAAALAIAFLTSFSSSYCAGFYDGWNQYYENKNEVAPVAPPCPIPTVNEENTYESGFTRGVITANNHDQR